MYPYTLKTNDKDLMRLLRLLSKRRSTSVPNHKTAIKLGMELKPIRRDIYLGFDEKYRRSFIALAPHLDCEIMDFDDYVKAVFKPIF